MSPTETLDIDHTGLLSEATLTELKLSQQPFIDQPIGEDAPAPEPFSDDITEEQLADVKQALITGDDLLLILGDAGSGKSTLLRQLGLQSGLRIQCFAVSGSERFSTLNLFAGMLEAFKRKPPEKLKDILDELIPCMQSMVARNILSAVILDDAHKVNQTELTQLLSGMLYINSQDDTLMRVALAALPDFEDRIPDLLPEGADMPYSSLTIDGFTPQRAAAYLSYRMQLAGFDDELPFSERDMASLVDHSNGMPKQLHALTADVLNEKHGRIEDSVPVELTTTHGSSFMQSRLGKLALGALATVLIIGGLLMFLPPPRQQGTNQSASTGIEPAPPVPPVEELVLIDQTASTSTTTNDAANELDNTGELPGSNTSTEASNNDSQSAAQNTPSQGSTEPASEVVGVTEITDSTTGSANTPAPIDNTDISSSPTQQATATSVEPLAENTVTEQIDTSSDTGETDNNENAEPVTEEVSDSSGTPQDETDSATGGPGSLESPTWILVQDSEQFTVQMSASRDRDSVENFLQRNPLPGPNSIFSFERDGVVWFALVHGLFPTLGDARAAVERMPESALRNQPWIRSIGRVQSILRTP